MATLVKCEVAKTKRNASKIVTLKCKLITNVIKVAYLLLVKSVKHDCFERHYKHTTSTTAYIFKEEEVFLDEFST